MTPLSPKEQVFLLGVLCASAVLAFAAVGFFLGLLAGLAGVCK